MNVSVLLALCLAGPMVVDQPQELIAVVDLRECLPHVPTSVSDRDAIMHSIIETEAQATNRYEALTKADAKSKLEGATALEVAEARILKLEFEEFRRREQTRLQEAEQVMFRKWHKQVDAAVKIVAERAGFTIILYIGQDATDAEVAAADPKQMLTRTHAAYVVPQERADITEKVVAEMSTDAFLKAVNETAESEQKHPPECGSDGFLHGQSSRRIR